MLTTNNKFAITFLFNFDGFYSIWMGTFLQNDTAHVFYSKVFSSCMRNRFLILTITKFEKIWDYGDFKNLKINTKHHQRACHPNIKFELFQTTFCIISKATLATKSCWLHKKNNKFATTFLFNFDGFFSIWMVHFYTAKLLQLYEE